MRTVTLTAVILSLVLAPALAAEVLVRPHEPVEKGWAIQSDTALVRAPAEKVNEPADSLFVPFFEVDTGDPAGTTTLFAVRNISSDGVSLEIRYMSGTGQLLRTELAGLDAQETFTRNVRDVSGLPDDFLGRARGFIEVRLLSADDGSSAPHLVGDYLQVDVGDAFATGERMVTDDDFCEEQELRFLDFGAGTELRFLIRNPRGSDDGSDPPSVTVRTYAEDGTLLDERDLFTDAQAFELTAGVFTTESFGTLVFDFANSGGGVVYGEYSADGKFSVGLNGACTVHSSL